MAKDFFGRILNLIADRMRPYMTPDRPEGRPEGMRMFGIGEDDGIPEYGRGLTESEAGELLALSFQKSRADLKIHKGGRSSAQDSIAVPVPDLYGDGGGIGRNIIYTFFAKHCWIGYKNCSLLLQHWLINRCCSLPAEDASAGGYRLEYADNNVSAGKKEDSKKKADLLPKIQAAAERRYGLSDKLRKLGFNRAGYGTGIAYFVIDGEDPETPLNLDGIRSGSFRGITIIEPQWCEPLLTETNVSDPLSPGWYRPEWYVIKGKKVHRSRLFTTLYREAPDDLKPTYNFGGIPLPQMIYERVYSAEKVANEMLELVQTKRTFVMQGNTMEIAKKPRQYEKIYNALSRFRNNQSIMVVDRTDENFTQMDTSLADTDGITWTLYQLVAGVASIPEYKLYGTAMKGLNSTGEGETKNYLQMLRGMQENVFEPFLRKAYAIICRSDLGNREKYDIVFNPLSVPTDAEQAATQGAKSSYYGNLINAGVVSPEEVRQALRQDENSGFTDIAEDLPEDAGGNIGGMPGNENGGQPPNGNIGGKAEGHPSGKDQQDIFYHGQFHKYAISEEELKKYNRPVPKNNGNTDNNTAEDRKPFNESEVKRDRKGQFAEQNEKGAKSVLGGPGSKKMKIKMIGEQGTYAISDKTREEAEVLTTYYPKTILGKERGSPMTFEEADGGNVNPKFNTNTAYEDNCQSCILAFIARLRGYDVIAGTYGSIKSQELSQTPRKGFIIDEKGTHPDYFPKLKKMKRVEKVIDFCKYYMKPEGLYAIEFEGNEGAHVAIAYLKNSELVVYDPQNGEIVSENKLLAYYRKNKYTFNKTCLFRIDNAGLNPEFTENVLEAAK